MQNGKIVSLLEGPLTAQMCLYFILCLGGYDLLASSLLIKVIFFTVKLS